MLTAADEYKAEVKSVGAEKQLVKVPLQVLLEPPRTAQSKTKRSSICESDPLLKVGLMLDAELLLVQAGVTSGSSGAVVFVLLGP